jgi:hypothetical protein
MTTSKENSPTSMTAETSAPIPQPPPTLFIGNVADISPSNAPASFQRLAEIYGEVYQLSLPGRQGRTIVVSSHSTVNDCCDASRFEKPIDGALKQVRALTGDGLFTAYPGEKVCLEQIEDATDELTTFTGLGRSTSASNASIWPNRHTKGSRLDKLDGQNIDVYRCSLV